MRACRGRASTEEPRPPAAPTRTRKDLVLCRAVGAGGGQPGEAGQLGHGGTGGQADRAKGEDAAGQQAGQAGGVSLQ